MPLLEFRNGGENTEFHGLIQTTDIRPGNVDHQSSMVVLYAHDQSEANLELRNTKIEGRIPGTGTTRAIHGAGIEAFWGQKGTHGTLKLDRVDIRDANGDGLLAEVRGRADDDEAAVAILDIRNSYLCENGGLPVTTPYLANGNTFNPPLGVDFSKSGLHVSSKEGATWLSIDLQQSNFDDNDTHGSYFQSDVSVYEYTAAYPSVEAFACSFSNNGLNLTGTEQGHGWYFSFSDNPLGLNVQRSVFSNNRSSGLKAAIGQGNPNYTRDHDFTFYNCLFSKNRGEGASHPSLNFTMAPLTVESADNLNLCTFQISQVTITDNVDTEYALSVYDLSNLASHDSLNLWQNGSSIDNCMFNLNNAQAGLDTCYYPEAPAPVITDHLWIEMFDSTRYSNLGSEGVANPSRYTTVNGNFYGDPGMEAHPVLGMVLPKSTSPYSLLIDAGAPNPAATNGLDVLAKMRSVDFSAVLGGLSPFFDIGAIKVQE
ncbi:MAG: hypothetical protein DWQ01_08965 [Planctomycetota bacterium]|nr:MAG: hypothetical protein DWQ01_08965 [Planctomycetota bacterium]